MKQKRLTVEDWGLIAPGRLFPLGNTKIKIKALSIEEIFDVLLIAHEALSIAVEEGITLENWNKKENLARIKKLLAGYLPQIVPITSDLAGEDFRLLPGHYQLDFIGEVIDENSCVIESAIKNSDALIAAVSAIKTMQSQTSQ